MACNASGAYASLKVYSQEQNIWNLTWSINNPIPAAEQHKSLLDFAMETATEQHSNQTNATTLLTTSSSPSLPREKWFGNEFLYQFRGFWFSETYLETTRQVLRDYKPLPTDIILASFPKTGTTWLKSLVHSIAHRSSSSSDEKLSLKSNHPQELIPSLETNLFVRKQANHTREYDPETDSTTSRRIVGTHIPYEMISEIVNSDTKIVYITRNPKDTLISLWHFVQQDKTSNWTLETAVDQFCRGFLPFGPYYQHVLRFREESLKRPEHVFFVTYEDLKEDGAKCVRKMADFLGYPFGEDETLEIEEIVKSCSFQSLSEYEVNKSTEVPDCFPLPYNSFFRKGEVGDSFNYLDGEMIQRIDELTRINFHASGFLYGI